jgi:hypothetical protein
MKRSLRNLLSNNNSKEQLININPLNLKKQKFVTAEMSTPPPQYTSQDLENDTFSDVLTVDTPRSDDTHTLHSNTSDSDTVTEEDNEYYGSALDKEIAIKNGKEKESDIRIFNEQAKLTKDPVESYICGQDKMNETVSYNITVKSEDKGKSVEVKKSESKLLRDIVIDTENKSLSISLDTELKCHSLTVKSNVQMIKISPRSAICPISSKPKEVQIIMHHQGRLINQHNRHNRSEFSNNPYSILLRNGLNYIEIWVKELRTSDNFVYHDELEDSKSRQKYSLFITKL